MRKISSVYLSGPDPWLPDAAERREAARLVCEGAGLEALTGMGGEHIETGNTEARAREIYAGALETLRRADAVIANLTPWRGPSCHAGSAFEAGFAAALGKPVLGYINVADEDQAEYLGRVEATLGAVIDEDGRWLDPDGCEIEDFGLPETLMLWAEARRVFVIVTPDPLRDLTGLELCLDALSLYAD